MQKDYIRPEKRIKRFFGVFIFCLGSSLAGAGAYGGIHSKIKKEKYNDEQYTEVMDKNFFGAPYTFYLPSEPIIIMVDDSIPEQYMNDIERAIDRLNEVSDGLTFKLVSTNSKLKNSLTIQELEEKVLEEFLKSYDIPEGSGVAGLAHLRQKLLTSEINKGSKIFINPDYYHLTYPVILHEVLHALGFKDRVVGDSIMSGSINSNTRDLTQDDIDALNYFYPAKDNAKEKSSSRTR